MDGHKTYHPTVTPPEQGRFTAVLSVADKNTKSRVYWSKKTLLIDVVANIAELQNTVENINQTLWKMYQELSEKYDKLVDNLPTTPPGNRKNMECWYSDVAIVFSVVDDSCDKDCGDHGDCVQGKCNCTHAYYGGEDCNECKFISISLLNKICHSLLCH